MSTLPCTYEWLFRKRWGVRSRSNSELGLSKSIIWLLANVVLFFSLLPYVSPFPSSASDVQLTAEFVAIVALFILAICAPEMIIICKEDAVVLGLGLLTLLYVNFSVVPLDMVWLRSCGGMLLAFPVYFAVRNLYGYMSPRVFIAVVAVYFAVLVLQTVFPYLYLATFGRLVSVVRWEVGGVRGLNGLCPEPSEMAYMAMTFIVSLYFFHREYWANHRRASRLVVLCCVLMLMITQSASAIIMMLLVVVAALLLSAQSARVKSLTVTMLVALVLIAGGIMSGATGRAAEFVSSFTANPFSLLQDESFIARIGSTYIGIAGLPNAPFGTGKLHLTSSLTNRAFSGELIQSVLPDSRSQSFLLGWIAGDGSHNNFGYIIQRMGIISVLIVAGLLSLVRGFKEKYVVWLLILGCLFNGSVFTPSLWFVIGSSVAAARGQHHSGLTLPPQP